MSRKRPGSRLIQMTLPTESGTMDQEHLLKSCLRKYFPENFLTLSSTTKVKSSNGKVKHLDPKINTVGTRKKRVSFAAGTVMVDRESKPYNRMLPKPRSPLMPDLFSGFIMPEFFQQQQSSSLQQMTMNSTLSPPGRMPTTTTATTTSNLSVGGGGPLTVNTDCKVNDYTKFTLAKKAPEHAMHTEMDRLPARVKRLFENIENLQMAHVAYNSLPSTEVREKFLLDQVIRRQIVSLEISMSEGLIHFAMDVIDTMYEATHFIRSLFHEDFYQPDGSHTILPIIMNNKSDDYINKLAPVIYALNRISGDRRRSDNTGMSIEIVCTKLQLEMISLTICPAKSLMFRSILEVVPSTAARARQLLEQVESKSCIKWVNNSLMRKDYTKILLTFHLIEKHDIVTKFPVTKKTNNDSSRSKNKKKSSLLLHGGQQSYHSPNSSNPAEKGDTSGIR